MASTKTTFNKKIGSSTPQGSSPPPTGGGPTTATRARTKELGQKEKTLQKMRVRDVQMAKECLEAQNMVIVGDQYTIQSLSTALLPLSQTAGVKATLMDSMRAVAILMVEAAKVTESEEVARRITEQMVLPTDQLESTIEQMKAIAKEIHQATKEMRDERSKTLKGLAEAMSALSKSATAVSTYMAVTAAGHQGGPQQNQKALASDLMRISMIARGNTKACQLLINAPLDDSSTDALANLEPAILVAKANLALEAISNILQIKAMVVSANKLRNGGIIYELDSATAATAIREEEEL
ncbi:hypothetical protein M422DRAFT_260915 [Sphaerobolus stellatus SS14]|uniref:Uncharacterized protein n=1 Tax=Sphaerobolus stellatus (strain SS14) TaxID=990650 RepID=A0A0C9VGW9_SPHS4|nr:hypothetical protein M422DRAFT_260915 [Sphaerobolus stellatus SS14]